MSWYDSFMRKKWKTAWRAPYLCLFWTLRKERNRKSFNDVEQLDQAIKFYFISRFLDWVRVYIEDHLVSKFVDCINFK